MSSGPGGPASLACWASCGRFCSAPEDGPSSTSCGRLSSDMVPPGDCSGDRGDPDVSAGEFGEDVEGAAAVLGRGGQVGAHRGEVLGAGEGAHAAGDLL